MDFVLSNHVRHLGKKKPNKKLISFGAFAASTETVFIFKCCNLSIHALEFGAAPVSGDTFSMSPAPLCLQTALFL